MKTKSVFVIIAVMIICMMIIFTNYSKSTAAPFGSLGTDTTLVDDINGLTNLTTTSTTVVVQDSIRGGTFIYSNAGPVDYGIIFPRANGGYWVRQTDSSAYSNWYKDSTVVR